jgi:Tat protein translocase TatB subunit
MFGIGFTELIVLAVVALVFVGPDRLPQFMKQLGKFFVHTRRMATDVRSAMDEVVKDAEKEIRMKEIEEMKDNLKKVGSSIEKEANEIFELQKQRIIAEDAQASSNSDSTNSANGIESQEEQTSTEQSDPHRPNEHSASFGFDPGSDESSQNPPSFDSPEMLDDSSEDHPEQDKKNDK